jgi:hypothetical protein
MCEHIPHRFAGAALRRKQDDFRSRMAQKDTDQFATGVTRSTQHSDLRFCSHSRSLSRSFKELPEDGQRREFFGEPCRSLKSGRHGDANASPVPRWHGGGGEKLLQPAFS